MWRSSGWRRRGRFDTVNSSAQRAVVAAGVLLAAAVLGEGRERLARYGPDPGNADGAGASCAAALLRAAGLGGTRALVADGLWLAVYGAWAEQDAARTEALLRLVTAVDGRPVDFWIQGARMIAYDMPTWPGAPGSRLERAAEAIEFLEAARKQHPESVALCVETANVHLYQRRDLELAARWYRRAAELPGAPPVAARIHAELLRRLGRVREARDWLCGFDRGWGGGASPEERELVRRRIAALEDDLDFPAGERYGSEVAARQTEIFARRVD